MSNQERTPEESSYQSPDGKFSIVFTTTSEGVLFAKASGYEDYDSSRAVVNFIRQQYERMGRKVLLCLDATEYEGIAPESRKYMKESIIGKDSVVEKFSVIGGNFLTRNLFNMFSKISNIQMKVFSSKEEAVTWLLER